MLVVISDLHFVDGTAGKHNVPFEAFTDVFSHCFREHAIL
jgi:hypothetical protein